MAAVDVLGLPAFLEVVATKLRPFDAIPALAACSVVSRADVGPYLDDVATAFGPGIPARADAKTKHRDLCKVATFLGVLSTNYPHKAELLAALDSAMPEKPARVPPVAFEIARATIDAKARIAGEKTSGFARCYYALFDDLEDPLVTATDAKKNFLFSDAELQNVEAIHYVNRYGTPSRMFDLGLVTLLAYEKFGGELGLMVARELHARKRQLKLDEKARYEEKSKKRHIVFESIARRQNVDAVRAALEAIPGADVDAGIERWMTVSDAATNPGVHPPFWVPPLAAALMLHKYTIVSKRLAAAGLAYDHGLWSAFFLYDNGDLDIEAAVDIRMRTAEERHFFSNFTRMDEATKNIYSLRLDEIEALSKEWNIPEHIGNRIERATKSIALRDFVRISGKNRALEVAPAHLKPHIERFAEYEARDALKRKR
jgi:hypothetical protein